MNAESQHSNNGVKAGHAFTHNLHQLVSLIVYVKVMNAASTYGSSSFFWPGGVSLSSLGITLLDGSIVYEFNFCRH